MLTFVNPSKYSFTLSPSRVLSMSSSPLNADDRWFLNTAARQIHQEQLQRAELFNGRAAMLGFVIGVLTEALTGQGILHQIGLGALLSQG
jgi:hypothetical protein